MKTLASLFLTAGIWLMASELRAAEPAAAATTGYHATGPGGYRFVQGTDSAPHDTGCDGECFPHRGLHGLLHWCPFYLPTPTPHECKTCLMPSRHCRPPLLYYFLNRYPQPYHAEFAAPVIGCPR